jgi:hypothetical protein
MAAGAKREPGLLRRWLQELRESWRRAGAIDQRADKARRAFEAKIGRVDGGGANSASDSKSQPAKARAVDTRLDAVKKILDMRSARARSMRESKSSKAATAVGDAFQTVASTSRVHARIAVSIPAVQFTVTCPSVRSDLGYQPLHAADSTVICLERRDARRA